MNKKLIVIIVTYNAIKWCKSCFDSLVSSSYLNDVLVIDNGSTDDTKYFIKDVYPSVKIIENSRNQGFGKANNIGLQYALEHGYQYAYLLNQDAWVMEHTFKDLIYLMENNPEYGIISPMQLKSNLKEIDVNFRIALERIYVKDSFLENFFFKNQKPLLPIRQIQAAHWLVKLSAINEIGLFSPSFPHYGEDNNLCNRMWYHNFKVGVATNVYAVHDRGERVDSIRKQLYLEYIKMITFSSNPLRKLNHCVLITFSIRSLKFAIQNRSTYPLVLLFSFIKNYRNIVNNRNASMKRHAFF